MRIKLVISEIINLLNHPFFNLFKGSGEFSFLQCFILIIFIDFLIRSILVEKYVSSHCGFHLMSRSGFNDPVCNLRTKGNYV